MYVVLTDKLDQIRNNKITENENIGIEICGSPLELRHDFSESLAILRGGYYS